MKSARPVEAPGYSERVRSLVLVLVAALCAVAAGCGGSTSESTATPADIESATTPARKQAPAIEGTSVEGEPTSLADYRGQAVLVNVWSSW
jgi:cytochrome oxidase Cu insertion factor (SCO1/SenC/PrrC family)